MNKKLFSEKYGNSLPILSSIEKKDADESSLDMADCFFSMNHNFGPGSLNREDFYDRKLLLVVGLPITPGQFFEKKYWTESEKFYGQGCFPEACIEIDNDGKAVFTVMHWDAPHLALMPETKWEGTIDEIIAKVIDLYSELTIIVGFAKKWTGSDAHCYLTYGTP